MFDCEPWYFLLSTGIQTQYNWVYYQHFWGVYSEAFANYSNSITAKVKVMKGNAVAEYEFMTSMFGKFTYNSVYWYNTNDAEY